MARAVAKDSSKVVQMALSKAAYLAKMRVGCLVARKADGWADTSAVQLGGMKAESSVDKKAEKKARQMAAQLDMATARRSVVAMVVTTVDRTAES